MCVGFSVCFGRGRFFSGEVFAADEVSLLSFAGSAGFGVGED